MIKKQLNKKKSNSSNYLRWGVERRMEFIEFRVYWEGRINRKDLMEKFGVSVPQASTDISKYNDIAPNNLHYNPRAKFYYASKEFKPKFLNPDSDRYLANLISMSTGIIAEEESWLMSIPTYDVLPQPRRAINPARLRKVVESIRDGLALQVFYQSMNSSEPEWRWITPHALAFDGYRWHTRAFCHRSAVFKDFVLARIINTRQTKGHELDSAQDRKWHEIIDVEIGPHPGLTDNQRKAIELDYGMENGRIAVKVRRGFLYYFLQRLGLDIDPTTRKPKDQQIILLNREEVEAACQESDESSFPRKSRNCI